MKKIISFLRKTSLEDGAVMNAEEVGDNRAKEQPEVEREGLHFGTGGEPEVGQENSLQENPDTHESSNGGASTEEDQEGEQEEVDTLWVKRYTKRRVKGKQRKCGGKQRERELIYPFPAPPTPPPPLGPPLEPYQSPARPEAAKLEPQIRTLIPPKHQMNYDRLVPKYSMQKLRTIRLKRRNNEGLGFAVRGGLEHGTGLYVSHVVPDSQAAHNGLLVGDEIVRLNGFTLAQAIHQEALGLAKVRRDLLLKVRNVGLIPVKENPDDELKWKHVENIDREKALQEVLAGISPSDLATVGTIVRLYISIGGGSGFGCSICSGPEEKPGIFIQSVKAGSLAQKAGLKAGDQILKVNDTDFTKVKHSEAVVALKSSRHLDMVLKRGAGLALFGASAPKKTEEDKKAEQLMEDAVVRDRVMDAVQLMEEGKEVTGRQVTIQIKDVARGAEGRDLLDSAPRPFMSLSSSLSSTTSSLTCSPPPPVVSLDTSNSSSVSPAKYTDLKDRQTMKDKRNRTSPSGYKPSEEKHELDRLKREYLKSQDADRTNPNVTGPLAVVTEQHGVTATSQRYSSSLSPGYLQQKPTFRFQKPVLLSPVRLEDRSPPPNNLSGSPVPEGTQLQEGTFNPIHLFTNEEIAGRQLTMVNIRKDGQEDLGLRLEQGRGVHPGRVLVAEIQENKAAHKQGGLHVGDQVMMVCGIPVVNFSVSDVITIMDQFAANKDCLQLVVAKAPSRQSDEEITLRPEYNDFLIQGHLQTGELDCTYF